MFRNLYIFLYRAGGYDLSDCVAGQRIPRPGDETDQPRSAQPRPPGVRGCEPAPRGGPDVSEDVPFSIRSTLLETYFTHLAEHGPKSWSENGKLLHAGDDFGKVFAWLWRSDQDEALDHLSD
jgi:hypothetical protein